MAGAIILRDVAAGFKDQRIQRRACWSAQDERRIARLAPRNDQPLCRPISYLRQRPSQVCDTNIQGDSATILRGGVRAGPTVFGHSDDSAIFLSRSDTSNGDAPSKSSVTIIGPIRAAVRYRLDPKRIIAAPMPSPPARATSVVESLGDLVAWRWRSGVQSLARTVQPQPKRSHS